MRKSGEREKRDPVTSIGDYGDNDEQNINRRSSEIAKKK